MSVPFLQAAGCLLMMRLHGFPYFNKEIIDFVKLTIDPSYIPKDKSNAYRLSYISSVKWNFGKIIGSRQDLRAQITMRSLVAGKKGASALGPASVKSFLQAASNALRDELTRGFYDVISADVTAQHGTLARQGADRDPELWSRVQQMRKNLSDWVRRDQREMLQGRSVPLRIIKLCQM